MDDNYYSILQISTSATQRDIKVAYRKLVQAHHPDVNISGDDEYIKLINVAYETLSDPAKKINYDNKLFGGFENTTHNKPYNAPAYRRTRRPPPPYSYWGYQGTAQQTSYTFSLKTQLIGWGATILTFIIIAVFIFGMHYYSSEYYYEKGLAEEKDNNLEGAIHFYQLAIRNWGGKSVQASLRSAELSRQAGAYHYMIDFCKRGLLYEPDSMQSARLYYLEGTAYYKIEKFKKAETAFLNSLDFNFNKDTIYHQLGEIYINHLGQYDKAVEVYSFLLASNSIGLADYYNRGISYQYIGKHQKAIDDFLVVLEDNPFHGKTLFQLGRSYLALGQNEKACYYLRFAERQSVNIDPGDLAKACD